MEVYILTFVTKHNDEQTVREILGVYADKSLLPNAKTAYLEYWDIDTPLDRCHRWHVSKRFLITELPNNQELNE